MKKIIVRSVFSSLFSVFVCALFLGGVIPGLSLWTGIPCAFAVSLALALLAGAASRPRGEDPGGKLEETDGTAGASPESATVKSGAAGKRGYEVYQRVVRYMEESKPFLDESLGLEQISKAVFSNKVYVSKNINYYSGRNVRQFINWYRIQHAIGLLKADPHLKMEDVSVLSGFHSSVSFNMAFRLFEGKTPTQWLEEYVDSLRKH